MQFGAGATQTQISPTSMKADPLFLLADVPGGDYYLKPASPAVDTAVALGYAADLDGVPVPRGAAPVNVTVTQATGRGHLSLAGAGTNEPPTAAINYGPGLARANNAIVAVNPSGLAVWCTQAPGTAHVVVAVNGFFQ